MNVRAYEGTDGELTLHPTQETLRGFLERDEEYWLGGSGSALIAWIELYDKGGYHNLFQRPALHLLVHPPFGVHLMYQVINSQPGTVSVDLVSHDPDVSDAPPVVHYLGGDPMELPRSSFLPLEKALQAITDFLQTEQPSSAINWTPSCV